MKKSNLLLTVGLSLFLSCGGGVKSHLPQDPKDKEEYRDSYGNFWVYNAMMRHWMVTPTGGGASSYYYPSSNRWTNASGITTSAPSTVKESTYRVPSVKPNSSKPAAAKPASKPASKPFGKSFTSKPSFGG